MICIFIYVYIYNFIYYFYMICCTQDRDFKNSITPKEIGRGCTMDLRVVDSTRNLIAQTTKAMEPLVHSHAFSIASVTSITGSWEHEYIWENMGNDRLTVTDLLVNLPPFSFAALCNQN